MIDKFDGGPVGIETISSAIGEERDTLEDVYEPYLIQEGFLQRTPRGRMATRIGLRTFGPELPEGCSRVRCGRCRSRTDLVARAVW